MAIALSIAYTATPLDAATKLAIEATEQVNAGIFRAPKGKYTLLTVTAAAAASPANILAAYNLKFGALISGRKIFFRLTPITATGIAGTPFETFVIVT